MRGNLIGKLFAQGKKFAIDKSPEILFAGGVVCIVAAGVCLWKARPKYEEILKEHERVSAEIEKTVALNAAGECNYPRKDAVSDRRQNMLRTAVAFVKLFCPIVLLAAGGIVMFGKSALIYKGRFLVAATVASQRAQWNAVLEDALGEEKVNELRAGEVVGELNETDENGKWKDPKPIRAEPEALPPFTYYFDKRCSTYRENDPVANRNWLNLMENDLTQKLRSRATGKRPGYLFLNEVMEALDLKPDEDDPGNNLTQEGQNYGWSYYKDPKLAKKYGAEGRVSFGMLYIEGDDPKIQLVMNCDPTPIIDRVDLPRR